MMLERGLIPYQAIRKRGVQRDFSMLFKNTPLKRGVRGRNDFGQQMLAIERERQITERMRM